MQSLHSVKSYDAVQTQSIFDGAHTALLQSAGAHTALLMPHTAAAGDMFNGAATSMLASAGEPVQRVLSTDRLAAAA